ncbi:MAG TPA: pentapeptide repeat-containing protein [Methylovirgula sp.]
MTSNSPRLLAYASALVCLLGLAPPVAAQDMTQGLDLSSPKYTSSDMTRGQIEDQIKSGNKNFSDRSLNGLDLSGLDLSGVNFRAARVDKTKFAGARLTGAILDQVWGINADFSGADLTRASLFAAQMQGANFNDADLSGARVAGDFSGAHMRKTKFVKADMSADMTNQSMGLMHAVLRSVDLEGADFEGANMQRADLQFTKLAGANFMNADLSGANASGADFRGAILGNTILAGCDVSGAMIEEGQMAAFAEADHLDRALKN